MTCKKRVETLNENISIRTIIFRLSNYHPQKSIINAFGFRSFKEYFLIVKKFTQHTFFKHIAKLIITGTVFIILFGNGVHIHSILDQLFDHAHIHITLHAHPSDHHQPESGLDLDNKDHHQHPIATIDLSGTLTQSAKKKIVPKSTVLAYTVPEKIKSVLNYSPPALLAQPPPGLKLTKYHFFFFTLRAPPVV